MSQREFTIRPGYASACPKCGNEEHFVAHSSQCAEDLCEVWIVCQCGYDPTEANPLHRVESVMGGLDKGNVMLGLSVWTEEINAGLEREDHKKISIEP